MFPHSATVAADNRRAGWQRRGHTLSCCSWLIFRLVDGGEGKKKAKMPSSADTLPAGESGEGRGFGLLLGFLASAGPNGPAVSTLSEQKAEVSLTKIFGFVLGGFYLLLLCPGGLV